LKFKMNFDLKSIFSFAIFLALVYANCPVLRTCSECVSYPYCNWCTSMGVCLEKPPFSFTIVPGNYTVTGDLICEYPSPNGMGGSFIGPGQCSTDSVRTCDSASTCSSCVADGCGWCSFGGFGACFGESYSKFCTGFKANWFSNNSTNSTCPAPSNCNQTTDCSDCFNVNGCDFCQVKEDVNICVPKSTVSWYCSGLEWITNGTLYTDKSNCSLIPPTSTPPSTNGQQEQRTSSSSIFRISSYLVLFVILILFFMF